MQGVEIDLEDSFPLGGGVLISATDFPTNGAALSRTKKRVQRGVLKNIFPIRRKTHKFIDEVALVFIKGIF